MKKIILIITACIGLGFSLAGSAHHSAVQFDLSIRDMFITGKVVEFKVANPHTMIILEVEDEKGKREIEFEGHSRSNYYRAGWRPGMVEIGDTVTIAIGPMRDGSDGGFVHSVTTADGTKF